MSGLLIREARSGDLEAIVRLHEEDSLGQHGDCWTPETRPDRRLEAVTRPDRRLEAVTRPNGRLEAVA